MAEKREGLITEEYGTPEQNQRPQAPSDRQGRGYDNDVPAYSWLRSDGQKKPSYDFTGKATKSKV